MQFDEMRQRLDGLVVFRELLQDEVVAAFQDLLAARSREPQLFTSRCAEFESRLFRHGDNWSAYLHSAVMESENVCIRGAASGAVTPVLEECLHRELAFLEELAQVTLEDLTAGLADAPSFLVGWRTAAAPIAADYLQRMRDVGSKGYGIFARYHVFTVEQGQLVPVKHPDPQRLEELPGYEKEREKVIANTRALLAGKPANNVLLYGDAGTGKSSAIKAIANAFADQGLRLVEVKKKQLYQIPDLMDALAANPLKFILFIDDLSFETADVGYSVLKTVLEGSIEKRPANVVIYATSNRRHLMRETFSERGDDEINIRESIEERTALSERFGIRVLFRGLNKNQYLDMVRALAKQVGLEKDPEELNKLALQWEREHASRTPRSAQQFIKYLQSL